MKKRKNNLIVEFKQLNMNDKQPSQDVLVIEGDKDSRYNNKNGASNAENEVFEDNNENSKNKFIRINSSLLNSCYCNDTDSDSDSIDEDELSSTKECFNNNNISNVCLEEEKLEEINNTVAYQKKKNNFEISQNVFYIFMNFFR